MPGVKRARAFSSAALLPITTIRSAPLSSRGRSSAAALAMISGPTPAGSPIVMARGTAVIDLPFQGSVRAAARCGRTRPT